MTAVPATPLGVAAFGRAAAVLREFDDPELQAVGAWLAQDAPDLLGRRAVLDERDRILRVAASFVTGDSAREKAQHLHERISRYRAGRWQARDRILKDCPYP